MVHILLLEDNPADVLLFSEALRTCPVSAEATVVHDAEQGLKLLQRDGFRPDLVVLDLNLSVMSGHDFLRQCCNGQDHPPCVVFSGSQNEKDRELALELGACEYARKPAELADYLSAVHGIVQRWGRQSEIQGAS